MKTNLRKASENLVKLKSLPIGNGSLETREDIIVFKIVSFGNSFIISFFFSAEIFAVTFGSERHKFGSDCQLTF